MDLRGKNVVVTGGSDPTYAAGMAFGLKGDTDITILEEATASAQEPLRPSTIARRT